MVADIFFSEGIRRDKKKKTSFNERPYYFRNIPFKTIQNQSLFLLNIIFGF